MWSRETATSDSRPQAGHPSRDTYARSACRQARVENDLQRVSNLQRAHQPAVRLDPPVALGQGDRAADTAIRVDVQLRGDRARPAGHGELAVDDERPLCLGQPRGRGAKRDRLALQDLVVDVLMDLAPILVGERLETTHALAHLQ